MRCQDQSLAAQSIRLNLFSLNPISAEEQFLSQHPHFYFDKLQHGGNGSGLLQEDVSNLNKNNYCGILKTPLNIINI